MTIEIRPLHDAFGAEVIGVDLSQSLSPEEFATVHRAHLDHGIILFRDQALTPEQHKAFSRRFGRPEIHVVSWYRLPDHPEIIVVSNKKDAEGKPLGLEDAGRYWHSDMSYLPTPALGSILYAVEVPPTGGATMFASMHAAFDALPPERKESLAKMRAVHHFGSRWYREKDKAGIRPPMTKEEEEKTPPVDHPIIRTHPENGRKSIYTGGFTMGVVGMAQDEALEFLDDLDAFMTQPQFVYTHEWRAGDVVFWDNRCTMHHATNYDAKNHTRHMHRTTINGDKPV
ncbi:MAG: TauD/TfdA family dioxygenase [Alphaproteobacteria bacterium]|nr:TauD/TfdA family dioxygenase [Alphaproteobacteria bacterium]